MQKKRKWCTVLIFLLFFIVVSLVYLGSISTTLLVNGDGLTTLSSKFFLRDSLINGELPLWNPFSGIGIPFSADVQQTVFSPLNLVFIFFDSVTAFNLFHILQLTFAGFFMYLYMVELFHKRYVGILIGFIFAFSSMIGGARIEHTTIITTIIFFPLILFFLERFKSTRKDNYLIYSAVAMAVHFLSGFTQIVIYFDIIVFIYFIYICRALDFSWKKFLAKLFKWIVPYALLSSIQLIPTLQLMIQTGRDEVPYDFFSYLSYDLRILLMMLFPYIFLNEYQSFGPNGSSGIDIEIYIGVICLIYMLYAIRYYYKDRFVKLMIGIMIGAFLYGMAPNIPLLGKLIHEIPVLGSFRVSARILSVFLLCGLLLCGYTMSKLDEKMEVKRLLKFSVYFTILIVVNAVIVASTFSQPSISDELSKHYVWNGEVFLPVVTLCLLNVVSLFLIHRYAKEKKYMKQVILGFLCLITIIDVGKYSIVKNKFLAEDILNDTAPSKIQELVKENQNYRSFALVKTPAQYHDNQLSLSKLQRGTIAKENYYNNYITFIDQKFKKYNIDETVLYPKTIDTLKTRNDLISMMSIRYILDSWNQELDRSILTKENEGEILSESNIVVSNNNSQLSVISYPVELKPNSTYKVDLKMNMIGPPSLFYVDFYNDTYDHPEQDGYFNPIVQETKEYSVFISTGDKVPTNEVYFRIVSQSNTDIVVENLSISKVKTVEAYKQIFNKDGVVAYENIYAKPILYVPNYVQSVDSYEPLYVGNNKLRLDESSYIKDFGKDIDLTQVSTEISDIKRKNNSVAATITSDKVTFINHAQLSYPGWKAYVDDEEVPIYNVNDLIQGIEVPEGTHQISFVFDPLDVKVGAIISALGLLLCCYYLFYNRVIQIFNRSRSNHDFE